MPTKKAKKLKDKELSYLGEKFYDVILMDWDSVLYNCIEEYLNKKIK